MLTAGHGLFLVLFAGMAIDHLLFHFLDGILRWIVQAVGVVLHFLGHKNPAVTPSAAPKKATDVVVNGPGTTSPYPNVFMPQVAIPNQMQNVLPTQQINPVNQLSTLAGGTVGAPAVTVTAAT